MQVEKYYAKQKYGSEKRLIDNTVSTEKFSITTSWHPYIYVYILYLNNAQETN